METRYFAYGVTLRGERYYDSHVAGFVRAAKPATCLGELRYLAEADMPALLPGEEVVRGMLFTVEEEAYLGLDYLHGARPERPDESEFVRRAVTCVDANGTEIQAFTYFLRGDVLRTRFPLAPLIADGDWTAFVVARRAQAAPPFPFDPEDSLP